MTSSDGIKTSRILGIFTVLVIVALNSVGPWLGLQQIVTLALLPALAVVAFFYDLTNFAYGKREFLLFIGVMASAMLGVFYYYSFDEYIRNLSSLFGAVIAAYIAVGLIKTVDYSKYFHIGFILSIILLFLIMVLEGNIGLDFATAVDYRDRFLLNANAYSYFCVFANFSLFYLYLSNKTKLLNLLLVILPILFLVITFTTQSRAGLVIIIFINVMFWVFINKGSNSSSYKKLLRTIGLVAVFVFVSFKFLEIYEGSRISDRVAQTSNRKDSREILLEEAIEVFSENPLMGVGLGQFPFYSSIRQFSHNSFTEILAEQGLIGGIFLYTLFLGPFLIAFKRFKKNPKDATLRLHLLFFGVFILYNNAYVFYKFPFSMMYFFLIVSLQNREIQGGQPEPRLRQINS